MLVQPRHVILISIENLRSDALSCLPAAGPFKHIRRRVARQTPALDRLVREGVFFKNCRSVDFPAAALLTGQDPSLSRADVKTVFARFNEAGFSSLAQVDYEKPFLDRDLFRGVEIMDSNHPAESAQNVFDAYVRAGRRVFLYLSICDLELPFGVRKYHYHLPYNTQIINKYLKLAKKLNVPATAEERKHVFAASHVLGEVMTRIVKVWAGKRILTKELTALYVEALNDYDRLRFARFMSQLEATGILEESWIVLTSQAARALAPNDRNKVRVPLLIWAKNHELLRGIKTRQVTIADVVPTVLGLAGISFNPSDFTGKDLGQFILPR